jgi:hypothetical protein
MAIPAAPFPPVASLVPALLDVPVVAFVGMEPFMSVVGKPVGVTAAEDTRRWNYRRLQGRNFLL